MDNTRDHNRAEASKAKKIALEKMENNDFSDAQQIILDAQNLYPELEENMSQMLIICKIHCAAESIVGDEKDLYGILQVEEVADETMITKQYRKIALSTHPDKCSFPGAQEAFKLVCEAYSVLSNPGKRLEHDYKRKRGSNKTDTNEGIAFGSSPTFWTRCPHCGTRFQYIKNVMNRRVICQTCKERFTTHPIEDQEPMPAEPTEHEWERKNESQNVPKEADKEPSNETDANEGSDMSGSSPRFWTVCPLCQHRSWYYIEALKARVICPRCNRMFIADHIEQPEESMTTSSGVSSDSHVSESMFQEEHIDGKRNIQEKTEGICTSDDVDNIIKEVTDSVVEERPCYSDNIDKETIDSVVLEKSSCCSDPGIKIRDINRLTYNDGGVDQIWALYDNIDHMPRAYAMVKCVGHSKCLCWLKFYPLSEKEKEWNNKSLPVACGKFILGEKVNISDYSSLYSHTVEGKQIYVKKVSGTKGYAKNKTMVYEIYPKRGEVWAIYKGWSKQWTSDADQNRSYEYDVVEVLSDMSDNDGANVIPLIRIMGFPSLLVAAKDKSSFHIPSSEVFRFSHRIPHYRVSGHENILKKINGPILEKTPIVPEGFLLLNSCCLPSDLDATFPSMNLDSYMSQIKKRSRKECQYEIFPQIGEIWAIFMDWAPDQSPSSADCCEFAVGEIIERNDASTKFSFLAKVDGCTAIFKPDKQKGVLEIPIGENLRFSHHIPATFRVMKEKGSKRRVYYDLDPDYLLTVQDHTTSLGNGSTVEDLAKKQKTDAAQVGPRRTARPTRPNKRYIGPQWK